MKIILSILIFLSCYNILLTEYNINATDFFPKLRAEIEIQGSTGIQLENPKNGESIYILNGDRISIKSTLDLFENYRFEYYDYHNGLIYISRNHKIIYAPINKIKWVRVIDYRKSDFKKTWLPIGGATTGAVIGFGIGAGLGLASCEPGAIGAGAAAGTGIGATAGLGIGAIFSSEEEYYKYSSKKIYLSGKRIWDMKPVDADEIINSHMNSAKPIY